MEGSVMASLQASLFTFALITLINPAFVFRKYLFKWLIPVPVFLILYSLAANQWPDMQISDFRCLVINSLYPTVIIRELFLFFYCYQLFYLARIFRQQLRKYKEEIDNYFAENSKLQLSKLHVYFYSALTLGICALLSSFFFTELLILIFTIGCSLFYLIFGIYYIQYPHTFAQIQPVIYPNKVSKDDLPKSQQRYDWTKLKQQILNEKYYLRPGVNIEEMARYLKTGRTTLSNFINHEEGTNFYGWINYLRVEEAKDLLIEYPDFSLVQIAEMLGYTELSSFSRQFKSITSQSPSLWRQLNVVNVN
jgi:AraC-like DNA-binding protein